MSALEDTDIEFAPDLPTVQDGWQPVNLNTLPNQPPVRPTLGQTGDIGLVYPGKRHVFSGPQESAKTLAAYAISIQIIRDGGTVILLDFEMGPWDARNRLRDLGATPTELDRLHYLEPEQPATTARIKTLVNLQPDLVLIDAAAGAYQLQELDDNKRSDVEKIAALYSHRFWKAGIATIMIDHVVKDTETRGKYAIGSERKVGGADVHLGFETITPISRGTNGLYKIVTHKDRGGYLKRGTLAELELSSHPDTHAIAWTFRPAEHIEPGETWMPTKVMEKISGRLEQQQEPVSRNTIVTEVGGNRDVALTAIGHLVRLEYATETAGPRGAKLLQTVRPFTVYGWENAPDKPPVPTGSRLVPEPVDSLVPDPSPPYGGREPVTGSQNHRLVPEEQQQLEPIRTDWLDDLTAKEHDGPPGDLHDQPNDDIPL